jgi:hypothetical protein
MATSAEIPTRLHRDREPQLHTSPSRPTDWIDAATIRRDVSGKVLPKDREDLAINEPAGSEPRQAGRGIAALFSDLIFAGQNVGIKQVSDQIWLVSFMDYDLGYFDQETCRLEPLDNPFGPKMLPMSPV